MALDHPPALILLGSQVGVLRASMFLDQLRGMPRLGTVPVVAVVAAPGEGPPPGADASIERTLDVERFGSWFLALVDAASVASPVPAPGDEVVPHPSASPAARLP